MNCRILYLVGRLHTGGLERQLCYLLRAMDRQAYKPAVAAWNYSEQDLHVSQLQKLGVPVYSFPCTASRLDKLSAFRRLVRELKPEVVHSYDFYMNFAAYWGAEDIRAVAIGSVRSDFAWAKKEIGPWLGRLSARWPSNQICNSLSAAESIRHSRSFFVPSRPYVVRNGLDLDRFQSSPVPTNRQVCISGIGNLLPAKRWDRLLGACLELNRKGLNCLIQIAGEGPLRASLEQQAKALGVADCVQFLGHRDDVPALLARANLLVHTADNEGCPNAVMEAMACGRAVVAMDAGDIPSLVDNGKTGFVIRRGDSDALIHRIISLVTDRNMCQRMGEAARMKAEREFGLNRLVQETFDAYRAAGWKDGY